MELGVRRDLAQRLAYRRDVPRDLVVSLANDEINVAYPVLVESVVLEDADLIAIAYNQPASHQIAVTLRERISPDVSGALIESRNVDVIDTLLRRLPWWRWNAWWNSHAIRRRCSVRCCNGTICSRNWRARCRRGSVMR